MGLKSFFSHIFIGILIIGIGFMSGYFIGKLLYIPYAQPDIPTKQISLPRQISQDTPTPSSTVSPTVYAPAVRKTYMVQSIGNSIYIYRISDESKEIIKAFDVNMNMFPSSDVELLTNGVETETLEEAYTITENFTS